MSELKHMFTYINRSVREGWNNPAFTDYGSIFTYTYGMVATQMAKLNLYYEQLGLKPGDKIAYCGANSSCWAISFLSSFTFGAVAVSILPDFTGEDIEKLVNHSDAQVLFVGPVVEKKIDISHMPALKAVISTVDFHLVYASQREYKKDYEYLNVSFGDRYPKGFCAADVHYREDNLDDLALINYTSGTTSNPKGVMLTYRALSSNVQYSMENMECHPGINLVSLLPLAHMFGMMIELIYQFAGGSHVYFVTRLTTPVLMQAFKECQPHIILVVPMVLEKIYEKRIRPVVTKPIVQKLWDKPVFGTLIKRTIRKGLMKAFGGKLHSLISGGAAINPEVEKCLMDIRFPYLSGYGMTECAPLVGYASWQEFKAHSCGRLVDRMQIRIDSPDPLHVAGEILLKGDNCMVGYYKNPEATAAAFTPDGWMRTGDLGTVDEDGFIFLRGRCKTMILGPSGQNIYPEEIESLLNCQPAIDESLIVSRNGKLIALVYKEEQPDEPAASTAVSASPAALADAIHAAVAEVNTHLPAYSQIADFEIQPTPFAKTPKRSIKRFMYA
ncbi:MAG: AMP-binding protein [Paludibacteraceae bacterium]|nr:AMP-binding protein [Paludibacteraceae bacterium]